MSFWSREYAFCMPGDVGSALLHTETGAFLVLPHARHELPNVFISILVLGGGSWIPPSLNATLTGVSHRIINQPSEEHPSASPFKNQSARCPDNILRS